MISRDVGAAFLCAFTIFEACAQNCLSLDLSSLALSAASCSKKEKSETVEYVSQPLPANGSLLDGRRVGVAIGPQALSFYESTGFSMSAGRLRYEGVRLINIPLKEGVRRRRVVPGKASYRGWTIYKEEIYYFSPQKHGYTQDCATAIRRRTEKVIVVSECFPIEAKSRFLDLLVEIKNSTN